MKNPFTKISLVIITVIALVSLMSFARPMGEDAKQYMLITSRPVYKENAKEDFEKEISQKMAEGWKPQGGMAPLGSIFYQAMVK